MRRLMIIALLTLVFAGFKSPKDIYIAGCGNDFIAKVDYASGEILWQLPVPAPEDCNDIELTKKGILYAYKQGARLVDEEGEVLWNFDAPKSCEVYTATVIGKNKYMIGICGKNSRILLIDFSSGDPKIEQVYFDTGIEDVHAQFRQIIITPEGNFLVPIMGSGEILELDRDGTIIKRIHIGGTLFSVHSTPVKGEYMVSCGDSSKIVIFRLCDGKITREINNNNLESLERLLFVAELKMLKNGNILVANWNGHVSDKDQPKILEIDRNNIVVSKLPFNDKIKNISSFYLK